MEDPRHDRHRRSSLTENWTPQNAQMRPGPARDENELNASRRVGGADHSTSIARGAGCLPYVSP